MEMTIEDQLYRVIARLSQEPKSRDTAESLLREMLEEWGAGRVYAPSDKRNLYDRARALLGGKGEG